MGQQHVHCQSLQRLALLDIVEASGSFLSQKLLLWCPLPPLKGSTQGVNNLYNRELILHAMKKTSLSASMNLVLVLCVVCTDCLTHFSYSFDLIKAGSRTVQFFNCTFIQTQIMPYMFTFIYALHVQCMLYVYSFLL